MSIRRRRRGGQQTFIPHPDQPPSELSPSVTVDWPTLFGSWANLDLRGAANIIFGGTTKRMAPLTLTYGNQPPRVGALLNTLYNLIRESWPDDVRLPYELQNPNRRYIVTLQLPSAINPLFTGALTAQLKEIIRGWPAAGEPVIIQPDARRNYIAAIILPTGDLPPFMGISGDTDSAILESYWPADITQGIITLLQHANVYIPQPLAQNPPPYSTSDFVEDILPQWPQSNEPRLPFNLQQPERRFIAPQTLAYGQQPPINGYVTPAEYAALYNSWPQNGEPRLVVDFLNAKIATLTLVYGNPPPVIGPINPITAQVINAQWPQNNEPRLSYDDMYPAHKYIVAQTLVYGNQPPVMNQSGAMNPALRAWTPNVVPTIVR